MNVFQVLGCMPHISDLGGVHSDIPVGLLSDIFIFTDQFNIKLIELEEMLNENRIWKQRLVGYRSSFI